MIRHLRKFHVILHLQPLEYLRRSFRSHVHDTVIVTVIAEQPVLSVVMSRHHKIRLVVSTLHCHVVILCIKLLFIQEIIPVRISIVQIISGGIRLYFGHTRPRTMLGHFPIPIVRIFHGFVEFRRHPGIIIPCRIGLDKARGILVSIGQHIGYHSRRLDGEVARISNGSTFPVRVLRRDKYHAESPAGSINGCRSRIFQYGNAGDIVRVKHRRISLDTIDQDERCASLPDRSRTAHVKARAAHRLAVSQRDVQVRNGSLQTLCHIRHRTVVKYFARHLLQLLPAPGYLLSRRHLTRFFPLRKRFVSRTR